MSVTNRTDTETANEIIKNLMVLINPSTDEQAYGAYQNDGLAESDGFGEERYDLFVSDMGEPKLNLDGLKKIAQYVMSTKLPSRNLQDRPVTVITDKESGIASTVTAAAESVKANDSFDVEDPLGESWVDLT